MGDALGRRLEGPFNRLGAVTTPVVPPRACAWTASASPFAARPGNRCWRSTTSPFPSTPASLAALVGPDGAGKTTLLRLLCGADDGRQRHDQRARESTRPRRPQAIQSRISYMPQQFGLYDDLTVLENLDLYADLHGGDGRRQADPVRPPDGNDRARVVPEAAGRKALRGHEAEARPGLHPCAVARAASPGRADGRRRPALPPGAVGDHPQAGQGRDDGPHQQQLS
jgi:hypothetical protein